MRLSCFFFNDTATTEIYTLSLHDALPISSLCSVASFTVTPPTATGSSSAKGCRSPYLPTFQEMACSVVTFVVGGRSEEHTSELQSRQYLVCRLLLEKKKNNINAYSCSEPR